MTDQELFERRLASPVGELRLVATHDALVGVYFERDRPAPDPDARPLQRHAVLEQACSELSEYFAGRRSTFAVACALRGTEFQRAVFRALLAIPFAQTRSYVEIARSLGRPGASRAVGASNRVNPLAIIVPCHRVIGADGTLTGYAGGLDRKRWLLDHEHRAASAGATIDGEARTPRQLLL